MTIEVTAKDIQDGTPSLASRCPVALALHRATGHAWAVYTSQLWDTHQRQTYRTPEVVRQFVEAYDLEKPVRPFSFQLAA